MGSQHTGSSSSSSHSFEIDLAGKRALFQCHWTLNGQLSSIEAPATENDAHFPPCRTLDLLFTLISVLPQRKTIGPLTKAGNGGTFWKNLEVGQNKAYLFVQNAIKRSMNQYGSSITALKLLVPTIDGYAVRNDIIQRRFLTCDLAEEVADFTTLRQRICAFDFGADKVLQRALNDAVGAVLLKTLPGINKALIESAMASLEADVTARLSFPWIINSPLPKKRLAMVDGRPSPDVSAASLGIYRAAHALGIQLVVLDHDGHWVQDSAMKNIRDEFIACDLTVDQNLSDRIVKALSKSKGPIDAITTYTDDHLLATARAAEKMGLFTNPPEVLEKCRDKQKMRDVVSADLGILHVTGVTDLQKQLRRLASPLSYPLIIKPTIGSSSEGVSKVTSEAELLNAIQRNEGNFLGVNSLIEPYISGPEVDANFVFLDGKLIWSEINDDFPSSAEISHSIKVPGESPSSSSPSMSFAEMSTIIPSVLPDYEISLLKSSLAETLLSLGFKNGVFHLEARVKDSRKNYAMTDRGIELVDTQPGVDGFQDPSIFLIEINARLPGHQESFAIEYTYGIDYFAVHMLMSLSPSASATQNADDTALKSVIRALNQPLLASVQYPTHIVFIPVERGGTFVAAKPLPESLMSYIPQFTVFMQEGDVIKDPDREAKWPFIAYFLVTAKLNAAEGREQVRTIGEIVRQSFEYEMQ